MTSSAGRQHPGGAVPTRPHVGPSNLARLLYHGAQTPLVESRAKGAGITGDSWGTWLHNAVPTQVGFDRQTGLGLV